MTIALESGFYFHSCHIKSVAMGRFTDLTKIEYVLIMCFEDFHVIMFLFSFSLFFADHFKVVCFILLGLSCHEDVLLG